MMTDKADDAFRDDDCGPDLTIVGGQPRKMKGRKRKVSVPVGLEKVLFCAAVDGGFRARLMEDRAAAIEESGISLRPSERAMLEISSDRDLDGMIDRIDTANPHKRKFMNLVAAAVTSLAAGTAFVAGCEMTTKVGSEPSVDTDTDTDTDMDAGDDAGDTDTDTDTDTVDTDTNLNVDAGVGPDDSGV